MQQTRYDVSSKTKSATSGGQVRQVVKGFAAVDASCPIAEQAHVYHEGPKAVYDALLQQTDIANNNNKYYIIQLLEADGPTKQYWAWNRWGRVGEERGYQNALRGPMSLAEAKKDFEKKFWDKSHNEWAERARFKTNPKSNSGGHYTLIERDYGATPSSAGGQGKSAMPMRCSSGSTGQAARS